MTIEKRELLRQENMESHGFGIAAMRRTKVCRRCGAMVTAKKIVCPVCRAPLPAETLYRIYQKAHKHCTHCQTVVSDDSRFCPQCGTELG